MNNKNLPNLLIKQLTVGPVTMLLGREFHKFIVRLVKKLLSRVKIIRDLLSFITFPVVLSFITFPVV